jgi:glycosyltransferase involved in cell wall biosynthesis
VSRGLVIVANTRLPSERAQALQVLQSAAAFARAGRDTCLLYARRRPALELPVGTDLFEWYGVPTGSRPTLEELPCVDWIERFPSALQYLPARVQELSFARGAARRVRDDDAWILSRELEVGDLLRDRSGVFLEIHRVPGGRLRRRWLARAADAAAGVLAISGGVHDDLVKLGVAPDKLRVEHDAFEPARFFGLPERRAARAELGLDLEKPLVVYSGGLLEWKGVELLVEAARSLARIDFLIVGGMHADCARLRKQAGGLTNLRLLGFQPPARVPLFLAAADLGVVPNRSQPAISARYTSPLKVFEAMAVGLPLVVSDLPSLREILSQGEAVFVQADDSQALASGIAELLADESRRRAMGERLLARAPRHGWDARAERILAWMGERAP